MGGFWKGKGVWGTGLLVLTMAGAYFLKGGTVRLTALAAKAPVVSFLDGEETLGNRLLLRASGVHVISTFLEGQDAVLAQADPAYGSLRDEQELYRAEILAAEAGSAGAEQNGVQTAAEEQAESGDGTQAAAEEAPAAVPEETGQETAPEADGSQAAGIPAMAATEITGTVYSKEELSDFEFVKSKFFYVHKSTAVYPEQLDASVLLGKDMTLPESEEPQILLFHTHGSEAFSDSVPGDESMTVVGIGNYLAELLSGQYGIQVIHNTEVFPYSDSYSLAYDMLEQTLAEHPSIQVTIDLHRDSGGHDAVEINGKPTAPVMFFNGMCQTPDGPLDGVTNPYLLDNLAFNFQMKLKAEAYYPGFTMRTFLKAYRYNQHVLPRATLVEVGTENNTYEEAKNAMEPLADILYKVLRGK